jgi:exodeoxyribonuclease VII small subunit
MPGKKPTFEDALQQLAGIVQKLESGQLPLDEALTQYEAGIGLVRRCQELLQQAQARVQRLLGVDEHGQAVLEPLPAPASASSAKPEPEA